MVNICVETVDRKGLNGVAPLTTPYKDTVNNFILLTEFNVSNKIQHICYKRMKLMAIRTMINKSITLRQLNPDIVKIIHQLKIQKRRKRGRRGSVAKTVARDALGFRYVNFSNLRQVTLMKGQFSDDTIKFWTKFGFGNIQSLQNKENLLKHYLVKEKTGLFLATESWLKNDIESQIQIQGSALNTDGYRISVANKETGSRGGGLALIYKDTLDCKLLKKGHICKFKHAYWEILGHI